MLKSLSRIAVLACALAAPILASAQQLTQAQLVTLKAAIAANPTWAAKPMNSDGAIDIAIDLNKTAIPDYIVWRLDAPVDDLLGAIDWSKYVPTDSPPNANTLLGNAEIHQYGARSQTIQIKQAMVIGMTVGRFTLDCSKANIRAGLRQAVIAIPSGSGGANAVSSGTDGITVLTACTRKATVGEKILTGASSTTGPVTAYVPGYYGAIQFADVQAARELP